MARTPGRGVWAPERNIPAFRRADAHRTRPDRPGRRSHAVGRARASAWFPPSKAWMVPDGRMCSTRRGGSSGALFHACEAGSLPLARLFRPVSDAEGAGGVPLRETDPRRARERARRGVPHRARKPAFAYGAYGARTAESRPATSSEPIRSAAPTVASTSRSAGM